MIWITKAREDLRRIIDNQGGNNMNLERIRKIISNLEHSVRKIEAKGCETGLTKAEFEDYLMVKQELNGLKKAVRNSVI